MSDFKPNPILIISVCVLGLAIVAGLVSQGDKPAAYAMPKVLKTLPAEQKAFIKDAGNLRVFGLTREKLGKMMANRNEESVRSTIAAMMETVEQAKYQLPTQPEPDGQSPLDPVGDMAAVPLNTKASRFNGGSVLRPQELDTRKRTPGPFSLKRYLYETDGIPTFAGAPIAIRKADLVAGGVEVAFLGVPANLSSGMRDAQHAPNVLRGMYGIEGFDIYAGIDPVLELSVVDYGNLSVNRMSFERSVDHIRFMVADTVDAGVVPFLVGGDHAVMYPSVAGMADAYGAENVGVVHFDAHANAKRGLAHTISDEQSVSRLLEDGLLKGKNLLQVGLRGPGITQADLEWLQAQGARAYTMARVQRDGWPAVMKDIAARAKAGPDKLFISFDISVLDPSQALAAGRAASTGLMMREVVPLVRQLCAQSDVAGFEMLDVAPFLDLSYQTALNANSIMHACLTGIAIRKLDLPLASALTTGD